MTNRTTDAVAAALRDTLISPNESDANMEPANVVDAIVKAGRVIAYAIDKHTKALERIAHAMEERNRGA